MAITVIPQVSFFVETGSVASESETAEDNVLKLFKLGLSLLQTTALEPSEIPIHSRHFSSDFSDDEIGSTAAAAFLCLTPTSSRSHYYSSASSSIELDIASHPISPNGPHSGGLSPMSLPGASKMQSAILSVGAPLNDEEILLAHKSRESIKLSLNISVDSRIREKIGRHKVRGTYFINYIHPKVCYFLSSVISKTPFDVSPVPLSVIAELRANPDIKMPKKEWESNGAKFLEELLELNIETIGVFKPADGILRGEKDGIPQKNLIPNEVIVSGISGLYPRAIEVQLLGHRGALSPFIPNATNFNALGSAEEAAILLKISAAELQKLILTDLRFCNADRHAGNLMCSPEGKIYLIDHALVLSAEFQTGGCFFWMNWPSALEPFTAEARLEIEQLDFEKDCKKIQNVYPNYPAANLETMEISYDVLKKGAANGLSAFEIAWLLKGDLMGSFYESAKGNPNTLFRKISQLTDKAIVLLQKNFPPFKEFIQRLRSEEEAQGSMKKEHFLSRLSKEMEKAKGLFDPLQAVN